MLRARCLSVQAYFNFNSSQYPIFVNNSGFSLLGNQELILTTLQKVFSHSYPFLHILLGGNTVSGCILKVFHSIVFTLSTLLIMIIPIKCLFFHLLPWDTDMFRKLFILERWVSGLKWRKMFSCILGWYFRLVLILALPFRYAAEDNVQET